MEKTYFKQRKNLKNRTLNSSNNWDIKKSHLPGSDFDLVVTTIFLISIFMRMKPKEKLVREDDEIKLGPILNCGVKYCWCERSKL